jgi:hypothetical protein
MIILQLRGVFAGPDETRVSDGRPGRRSATSSPRGAARSVGEPSAVPAGFITWLARRRLPATQRPGYHLAIEGFLRWCASEAGQVGVHRQPWCYCQSLELHGASHALQVTTRHALVLFEDFLFERGVTTSTTHSGNVHSRRRSHIHE